MLTLPIKKKWFDLILSGEKKEEYREIKPYWTTRFKSIIGGYDFERFIINGVSLNFAVRFQNGYSPNSSSFDADVYLEKGTGKPEWGAKPKEEYYVLKIGKIYNVSLKGGV